MFGSKRITALEYKAESLRSHDVFLDIKLETLREENKYLRNRLTEQGLRMQTLMDYLGLCFRFVEEHYEVAEKEEPNVD